MTLRLAVHRSIQFPFSLSGCKAAKGYYIIIAKSFHLLSEDLM